MGEVECDEGCGETDKFVWFCLLGFGGNILSKSSSTFSSILHFISKSKLSFSGICDVTHC